MHIKDLIPWGRKTVETPRHDGDHPVLSLQRDMNRMFDQFWHRLDSGLPWTSHKGALFDMPRTDIVDTDKAIEITIELPGIEEQDLDVSLTEDAVTVKGEKTTERRENAKGYVLAERSFGSFYRTIPLPPGIETNNVSAIFKKGVLTLTLPKSAGARAKVKKIEVHAV